MMQHSRTLKLCCAILGGFLIQFTLGAAYYYGSDGFSWDFHFPKNASNSSTFLNQCDVNMMHLYLLSMFGLSSTMSLGGYVKDKVGLELTILIGSSIFCTGVFCSRYQRHNSTWDFPIIYGLISSLGAGLINSVSLSASCKYFRNKGLFVGIVLSGYAMGPMLLKFIKNVLIERFQYPFVVLGVSFSTIQIISILLLHISERSPIVVQSVNTYVVFGDETVDEIKPHNLIFQYDFWIIWVTFFLNAPGSIIMVTLQEIIERLRYNTFTLNLHSYVYCFAESIGRIMWGFLIDRFPYRTIVTIITVGSAVISVASMLCFKLPDVNNDVYNAVMVINYFWLSGNYSIFPSMIVKRFGTQHFDKNYGLLWTAYSFAGIVISASISSVDKSFLNLPETCAIIAALQWISSLLSLTYAGKNRRIHINIFGLQIS